MNNGDVAKRDTCHQKVNYFDVYAISKLNLNNTFSISTTYLPTYYWLLVHIINYIVVKFIMSGHVGAFYRLTYLGILRVY